MNNLVKDVIFVPIKKKMKKIISAFITATVIFVLTLRISWPYQDPAAGALSAEDSEFLTMYYGGMHENALARLDALITRKPERPDLLLMKGHVLRQLGDPAGAAGAYIRAAKADPGNFSAGYYYSFSKYLNGEFADSLDSLGPLLEAASAGSVDSRRGVLLLKALDEMELKKYNEAVLTLEKLNGVFPDFSPYLHMLARAYEKKGDVTKAREAYLRAYKNDTSNFEILFDAAPLLLKSGDIENAYKYYKKICDKIGGDVEIRRICGELAGLYKKLMAEKPPAGASKPLEPKRVEPVVSFTEGTKDREILVGLNCDEKGEPLPLCSIKMKCSGKFSVYREKNGERLFTGNDSGAPGGEYEFYFRGGEFHVKNLSSGRSFRLCRGNMVLKPAVKSDTVLFKGVRVGAGSPWEGSEARYYRGNFIFVQRGWNFNIVNRVELESYLASVLPSEMPPKFPAEALKAQAICARSEAIYKKTVIKRHAKHGYDLCDDQHCQMYRGVSWENPSSTAAVAATAGQVITYREKICDAIYSDNCGGHTQSSADISGWGDAKYLTAVSNLKRPGEGHDIFSPLFLEKFIYSAGESYCMASGDIKNYQSRWMRRIDARVINETLKGLGVGDVLRIIPRRRAFSGHVDSLEVVGTKGRATVKNELKIRRLFSYSPLRSSKFIVETAYDRTGRPRFFMFVGAGFGHGVGMCQSGACGMAGDGKNFNAIVKHYFKDVEISSLNKISL